MTRILLAATLALVMPALVLSQVQHKQVLSQTERQLIALSRKAVVSYVGSDIVIADRFASTATVEGRLDTVELVDARLNINGDQAVVRGRVIFKGGLPERHAKERASGVTIRFTKREGHWRLDGLYMGECVNSQFRNASG